MTRSEIGENSYVQTSELPVPPEIQVDGANLLWSLQRWEQVKAVRSRPAMLDQFVRLANGSAEVICRFARKFGILGICAEHGKPTSHNLACDLIPGPPGWWAEPLDCWRLYARQFQAVLRIADES